jgi:metal-sulfur cluster biosynthetic enzyme
MATEDEIRNALKAVKYPGYSRDIVSFGLVKQVAVNAGAVSVTLSLTSASPEAARQLKAEAEQAIKAVPGVRTAYVEVKQPQTAAAPAATTGANPWAQQAKVPGLNRIIAVASGKGGVGKSTVSANLACGLQHLGKKVGLLDCDIYGPSIPLMMGVREKPRKEGRFVGLRYLRPFHTVDDGCARETHHQRRAKDGATGGSRGEGHEHGAVAGRRSACDLARPDDCENYPAIFQRRGVGRTGLFTC